MAEMSPIRENLLREFLAASRDEVSVGVRGIKRGFMVDVRIGENPKWLATSRGELRMFASLDTAAAFVESLGVRVFKVDMSTYQPGRLREARPDRAAALKFSHGKAKKAGS